MDVCVTGPVTVGRTVPGEGNEGDMITPVT